MSENEVQVVTGSMPPTHIAGALFAAGAGRTASTEIEVERAVAEAKIAMLVAKQLPRDENLAFERLLKSCLRPSFAEKAVWKISNRGQGGGVRLAEEIARVWGNLKHGYIEHSHDNGQSVVEGFAWDLETNTYALQRLVIEHVRFSNSGGKTELTNPDDVRGAIAKTASKMVRNCIFALIPADIKEQAVDACFNTNKKAISDWGKELKEIIEIFSERYGVTAAQIEHLLGKRVTEMNLDDVADLKLLRESLKSGEARVGDVFSSVAEINQAIIKEPATQAMIRPNSSRLTNTQPAAKKEEKKADPKPATPATPTTDPTAPSSASPATDTDPSRQATFTELKEAQDEIAKFGWTSTDLFVYIKKPLSKLSIGALTELVDHCAQNPKNKG